MVKTIDFRQLSPAAINEIMVAAGVTDEDREWLRSRSEPVGALEFPDRYKVSRAQQKKAHVLLQAICRWSGYTPLETEKTITKQLFLDSQLPTVADDFSLSDCSREIARMYITYLIDFCLLHDIPCGEPMWKLAEDIPKFVYMALIHKRCAICGQKAEMHHVDAVGMGRNRKEICHRGMRVLPLCRTHHTEIHTIGREDFLNRYILEPVKVDERIEEIYHLGRKAR